MGRTATLTHGKNKPRGKTQQLIKIEREGGCNNGREVRSYSETNKLKKLQKTSTFGSISTGATTKTF